jgi:hypothetical protein
VASRGFASLASYSLQIKLHLLSPSSILHCASRSKRSICKVLQKFILESFVLQGKIKSREWSNWARGGFSVLDRSRLLPHNKLTFFWRQVILAPSFFDYTAETYDPLETLASANFIPRLPASNQTLFWDLALVFRGRPCVALGSHDRLFVVQTNSRVTAHHSDGGWTEDELKDPGRFGNSWGRHSLWNGGWVIPARMDPNTRSECLTFSQPLDVMFYLKVPEFVL